MRARRRQSGQVLVLVALALVALIGSAALVLLAGSFEWQRNQLQQLADQAALDSSMKIGIGCSAAAANTVITEADNFIATQRVRTGALAIVAGTCATPYTGTDTFAGGLGETIHYPYLGHQQQVEVILNLALPISFGSALGASTTSVTQRAVAQQLSGSVPAVTATTLSCAAGQVNVAGSVVVRNLITRAGTCAIYAHTRFDAASGSYSDLGNVSVYADSQTWTAPGTCAAGLNSGSTSAICADGYELSGHTAPACATAATSYLSAGDAAINSNPCAAGKVLQPVPPVSILLPPDPNTDAPAIATLPSGIACSAGAAYPNLVVAGATVGTAEAGTPAPVKDAAGYYHFKPSCYGYVNASALSGAIKTVQMGPEVGPVTTDVIPTLPVASTAGTLLVAVVKSETNPSNKPFTAPAGWVAAVNAFLNGTAHTQIWYYPNNPGGITSADFGVTPASINAVAQMTEWSGVAIAAPLDRTRTLTTGVSSTSFTIATAAAMTSANELVVTDMGLAIKAPQTYAPGAGWLSLVSDMPDGFASEYRTNLGAVVASETVTTTTATTWASVMATFKPSGAGSGSGVVFDPGLYYFNGSGFAGGGGLCLNGGTVLARDVTLEFVNQAGFSSGTCAAGGGGGCASGSCQFGSTPCSISVCPPNVVADAGAGGFTWFAAPCAQAPAADASCAGSAWCPVGDRACWNLLVWAPASSTGQIAISGTAAKAWLLGSVLWPGTCSDTVNGTSTLAGSISCGSLSVSAAAGAGTAIGGDYGISTALVEAVLVE